MRQPEGAAADGAGEGMGMGMGLGDYWMAVYRRRWMVLLVTLSAAGFSGYFSTRISPIYEARTEFYVPGDVAGFIPGPEYGKTRMPSGEQEHAKAYTTVLKGLVALQWVSERFPQKSVRDLRYDVDFLITRLGLIQIYARDADPQAAADLANCFVDFFNQFNRGIIEEQLAGSLANLDGEIARLKEQRQAQQELRRTFQQQHRIAALATRLEELESQKLRLEENKKLAEVDLQVLGPRIAGLEEQLRTESNVYVAGEVLQDSLLAFNIRNSIVNLEQQIAARGAELREDHPEMQVLQKQVEEARENLRGEMARVVGSRAKEQGSLYEDLRAQLVGLYVDRSATEARVTALAGVIRGVLDEIAAMPDLAVALERLNAELGTLEGRLVTLQAQRNGLVAQSLQLRSAAIVLEKASPPDGPAFPILPLNVAVAAVAGLVVGILYALLLDYIAVQRHRRTLRRLALQEWVRDLTEGWGSPGPEGAA